MPIVSPALSLAVEALFGAVKPRVDVLRTLGITDFSDGVPSVEVKPGATIKIPVSSITAAKEYNAETNNYLTGGDTDWASLTATHYLQGFDLSGVDVDRGVNQARIRQLFSYRAGSGISAAMAAATAAALDGATASTAVTLTDAPDLEEFIALGAGLSWLDRATSCLAVNGATLAQLRAAAAANNLAGTDAQLAEYLGMKAIALVPGMAARALIVPETSIGFIARVPAIVADYQEAGVETDPDSGLSVGIVVADDQATNRQIINADLWFGCTVLSANAAATTPGVIKVGTAA